MGRFIKGDVVVIPFPFSDLSDSKRRPALIVANPTGDDYILLQITSKSVKDDYAVLLSDADFKDGSLKRDSNIRPNKIFTADKSIILYKAGSVKNSKFTAVVDSVVSILRD